MRNNQSTKTSECDRLIKEMLTRELPDASTDEWFTKKVMNRLPDKRNKSVSWAEKMCYIIGAAILVISWGSAFVHTCIYGLSIPVLTIAAAMPVITVVCILIFFAPEIRRNIELP